MTPPGAETRVIRDQLERILASSGFARNERLSRFLRFVVERHVDGRAGELKESVIGTEVFGKRPDYNPKQDAIVRTEAGRLRARLAEYYANEGAGDALVIELPKGGYAPAIRRLVTQPPTRRPIGAAVGLAILAMALAVAGWWWTRATKAPITIAVLPLENLNHDPALDYLADGLTDELIRNLSAIEGLSPRSRTSSFAFKGRPRDIHEAGKDLGADYIVEGSVVRAAGRLRIDAQLVRVRDDYPIWSGKFDRDASDALAMQDEISRNIINSLRVKLGRGRRRYEASAEAYDLYLHARAEGLLTGYSSFEAAIAKDPSFAPAYAGLAASYAYRTGNPKVDVASELAKMRAAAEKAIELDPLLAEAHSALGIAYARDGQWAQAEASFRKAIAIEPSRAETYGDFAINVLVVLGRDREALDEIAVARRLDPLSPEVRSQLAYVYLSSHHYDQAAGQCEQLPVDCRCWPAPSEPMKWECLGRARLGQGRVNEGVHILEGAVANGVPPGAPIRGYLAYAYGRAGRVGDAEKIAETDWPNPYHQALAFSGMGDKSRAIEALEKMASQGPVRLGVALAVPELEALRDDPRVKALRRQVGLPE